MIKISIVIPTYNEHENVQPLFKGIRKALDATWDYEIIVVDDNSPDGTSDIVKQEAVRDARIKLLQRPGKLGLGSALVDGFSMATGDYWVMMDGDLSHRPEDLPDLIDALSVADIAVGSRYTKGGAVANWPMYRKIVSRGASAFGRLLVGLEVRDTTSGFAAFRRETMLPILDSLNPKGFKLLLEILAKSPGSIIKEVPITFVDRQRGKSKFTANEVVLFLMLCLDLRSLRIQERYAPARMEFPAEGHKQPHLS